MFEGEFAEITSDAINESSNRYKLFTMQDKAALEDILKKSYGKNWIKGVKRDSLVIDTGIAINLEAIMRLRKTMMLTHQEENKAILDTTTQGYNLFKWHTWCINTKIRQIKKALKRNMENSMKELCSKWKSF